MFVLRSMHHNRGRSASASARTHLCHDEGSAESQRIGLVEYTLLLSKLPATMLTGEFLMYDTT
ncbi:hypothetical protein ACHAXS_007936 [Conticribra weissflogii]